MFLRYKENQCQAEALEAFIIKFNEIKLYALNAIKYVTDCCAFVFN